MKPIAGSELMNITGGAVHLGALAGIFGGIIFVIGLIDGIVRPLACKR